MTGLQLARAWWGGDTLGECARLSGCSPAETWLRIVLAANPPRDLGPPKFRPRMKLPPPPPKRARRKPKPIMAKKPKPKPAKPKPKKRVGPRRPMKFRPGVARLAWLPKDDRQLRELWVEGASARVCSEEMGRSLSSVKNRAGRLGLRRYRRPGAADV